MLDVSIVIPVLCKCCSFLVDSLMETGENPEWLVPVSPVVRYESNDHIVGVRRGGQPEILFAGIPSL